MNPSTPDLIMALDIESQGIFEEGGGKIHYCGIGKINAAYSATKLIANGARGIVNLGTAGSSTLAAHTLVQCKSFVQRDMDLSPLGFARGLTPMDSISGEIKAQTLDLGLPWGVCGTGDVFEVGPAKVVCDLVDMEAYAIAKVCAREGVPFYSYKYITDGSDESAHVDWKNNLRRAAVELYGCYQKFLNLIHEQKAK